MYKYLLPLDNHYRVPIHRSSTAKFERIRQLSKYLYSNNIGKAPETNLNEGLTTSDPDFQFPWTTYQVGQGLVDLLLQRNWVKNLCTSYLENIKKLGNWVRLKSGIGLGNAPF